MSLCVIVEQGVCECVCMRVRLNCGNNRERDGIVPKNEFVNGEFITLQTIPSLLPSACLVTAVSATALRRW